jgi:polyisoprenoid-binding protein YceI
MSKISKISGVLASLIIFGILLQQCKNSDETSVGTLSGKVSLENGTIAGGAIVTLSTEANAANVIARVVADVDGIYSIMGIDAGTYYLNATWEPSNNNNLLKATNTVILSGQEMEVSVSGDKTSDIVLTGQVSGGSAMVDVADGWIFDNTHSTVEFGFPYDGQNAVFTGHFMTAGLDEFHFDEATPANIKIKAWVDITSVETGAPSLPCGHGRDGITGCIANTFNVEKDPADTVENYCSDGSVVTNWPNETPVEYSGDLWGNGSATGYMPESSVMGSTGVATFKSTEVTPFGTGYLAKGDFTFAGTTKSVDLYFNYLEGYTNDDNTESFVSFYGWFKFAALNDFGISSSHVGDNDVTVKLSLQLNKTL